MVQLISSQCSYFFKNIEIDRNIGTKLVKKNLLTLRESVRIRSFSGTYFPAFRLNTERYGVHGHFSHNVGSASKPVGPFQKDHFSKHHHDCFVEHYIC